MWLAWRIIRRVRVLVVLVVRVKVVVLHGFMVVQVLVSFGQVQPDTQAHENCRRTEADVDWFSQERERDRRADEWRGGEICARSRGADVPQGEDK